MLQKLHVLQRMFWYHDQNQKNNLRSQHFGAWQRFGTGIDG
jgi:hypothetical protein